MFSLTNIFFDSASVLKIHCSSLAKDKRPSNINQTDLGRVERGLPIFFYKKGKKWKNLGKILKIGCVYPIFD